LSIIFSGFIVLKRAILGLSRYCGETGVKGRKAFTGYDELWEILNTDSVSNPMRKEERKPNREASFGKMKG